jgi:hypothetical protein
VTTRERILAALDRLGADELEVLAIVSERLVMGRSQYGELQLATDRRDFRHEALLELADGCVYLAAGIVRAGRAPTVPRDKRGERSPWQLVVAVIVATLAIGLCTPLPTGCDSERSGIQKEQQTAEACRHAH